MPDGLQGPAGKTRRIFPFSSRSSFQTLPGRGEPAEGGDGAATRCLSRGVWMVGCGGQSTGSQLGCRSQPPPHCSIPPKQPPGQQGARGVQEVMGEPASARRDADSSHAELHLRAGINNSSFKSV